MMSVCDVLSTAQNEVSPINGANSTTVACVDLGKAELAAVGHDYRKRQARGVGRQAMGLVLCDISG